MNFLRKAVIEITDPGFWGIQKRFDDLFEEQDRRFEEQRRAIAQTMLGVGANLTASNRPRRAFNFQKIGLVINPDIADGYLNLFETCVNLRDADGALKAFGDALKLAVYDGLIERSAGRSAVSLESLLSLRKMPTSHQRMTIFTSLMPRRLDIQKAAVDSWLRAGFIVRSVNIRKEIDQLEGLFPKIEFIEFSSDGGFLVPIGHLCRLMVEDENPIVGIVNSDIIFLDADRLIQNIQSEIRGSLIFGHRQDLQSPADTIGSPYQDGFDYFFMERENWDSVAKTSLLMGMPFWDYWVPLAARLSGLVLKKHKDTQVVHLMHPMTYDLQSSMSYACKYWRDFAVGARETRPGEHDEFAVMLCRAGRMLPDDAPENLSRLFDFSWMSKLMIDAGTIEMNETH